MVKIMQSVNFTGTKPIQAYNRRKQKSNFAQIEKPVIEPAKTPIGLAQVYFTGGFKDINLGNNSNKVFNHAINYENGTIKGQRLTFLNAQFNKDVNFSDTTFDSGKLLFNQTIFNGHAGFNKAKFKGEYLGFGKIEFNENAGFRKSEFEGENLSFAHSKAKKDFNFSQADVDTNSASFGSMLFEGEASFVDATINAYDIYFDRAVFKDIANFSGVDFWGKVHFEGMKFDPEKITFKNAYFEQGADFTSIPPGHLYGLLSGATYAPGTEDMFYLPQGVPFEDLGLAPARVDEPTLEELDIKEKGADYTLEELGIKAKDAEPDYKYLGIKPPKPIRDVNFLLDELKRLPEGDEKEKIKEELRKLYT